MALPAKTKVFQVRVEPELYEAYQEHANRHGFTVSQTIRGFMRSRVRMDQEAAASVPAAKVAPIVPSVAKTSPSVPRVRPNDKKLRRLERKADR